MKERKQYKLASSKRWMEKEGSGFSATFLKLPQRTSIYQLKTGKAVLDVIPYVVGKGNPTADEGMLYWERTFFVHRGIGPNQSTYVCPARTLEKPCPICEARMRMMKNAGDDDEEFKMAKALTPKEWQLVQLRDKNAKEKGIQILPLSYFRFGEALKDAASAGDEADHWEHFWHPSGGKTLKVQWAEDSMGSTKFIRAKTVLFTDREDIPTGLIDKGLCLDDLLIIHEYKKLKAIFLTGAEKDEEDDDDESEEEEDDDEPKKKKKGKSKEESEDDDDESEDEEDSDGDDESDDEEEDDNDSEDEDDDEEEEKPKKKKGKKDENEEDDDGDDDSDDESDDEDSEDDEDDSDENEEDDSEDEEEEAPKKKRKFGDGKAKVKTKDEEDEENDDEGEESDDDEEDDSDESESDDDEKKPAKKGKKKPVTDWDDFDKDDDEDKPKKKKKK